MSKTKTKCFSKRALAWLLTLVMALGVLPTAALANGTAEPVKISSQVLQLELTASGTEVSGDELVHDPDLEEYGLSYELTLNMGKIETLYTLLKNFVDTDTVTFSDYVGFSGTMETVLALPAGAVIADKYMDTNTLKAEASQALGENKGFDTYFEVTDAALNGNEVTVKFSFKDGVTGETLSKNGGVPTSLAFQIPDDMLTLPQEAYVNGKTLDVSAALTGSIEINIPKDPMKTGADYQTKVQEKINQALDHPYLGEAAGAVFPGGKIDSPVSQLVIPVIGNAKNTLQMEIPAYITFKVVNGTWADKTTADIRVKVALVNGEGTLAAADVPTGMIPGAGTSGIGGWDVEPMTIPNMITGDVTYTYIFVPTSPEQYTVTYDPGDGTGTAQSDPAAKDVAYEIWDYAFLSAICQWAPPADKEFSHWEADGTRYDAGQLLLGGPGGDLELTAAYKDVVTYTVTFNPGSDGKFKDSTETEIKEDNIKSGGTLSISVPEILAEGGKIFIGWKNDVNGGLYTSEDVKGYVITEDITFTAQYVDGQSVVIFNFAGGANQAGESYEAVTGVSGDTLSSIPTDVTWYGQQPTGWTDETGTTVAPADMAFGDNGTVTTYYAKWEVEVTFAIEGGTWDGADSAPKKEIVELIKGVGTLKMAIPTEMKPSDGFSAIGDWDIAPMQTILGVLTGNKITFTYKFVPTDYKVTYDPGEGTGTAQSDPVAQNAPYEIWDYAFLSAMFQWAPPAGKEFSHWEADGTRYDAGQLLLGGPGGDLELTAVYKDAAVATVTFEVVNGTWADGTTSDKTVTVVLDGGAGTLAAGDVPTGMRANSGYTGGSWDVKPNTAENGVTGDVTYTYTFTRRDTGDTTRYTLSFETNGGSRINPITRPYGTVISLNRYQPTRDGYTFDGWYADEDLTQPVSSVTLRKDWTVYAKWTALPADDDANDAPPAGLNSDDHIAYVVGYTDGTVRPNGNITRAEVASMFYRLLTDERRSEIYTTTNRFSDVAGDMWCNKAVSSMAAGGYVTGYADGSFGPDQAITRAEFVAIAARFVNHAGGRVSFSDVSGSHWAYEAIATAVDNGWITGYEDGTFRPNQNITRAEAMAIINRMLDRGVDEKGLLGGYKAWPDNASGAWYYYEVIEATNDHEYTGSRPSEDWTSLETGYKYDREHFEMPNR